MVGQCYQSQPLSQKRADVKYKVIKNDNDEFEHNRIWQITKRNISKFISLSEILRNSTVICKKEKVFTSAIDLLIMHNGNHTAN